MKLKITSSLFVLSLILSGCSSAVVNDESPEPAVTSSDDGAFAIQTVKDRFESDCFASLGGETAYRYEQNPGGTMREGFVYASVAGNVLQFSVGLNENTGSFLTLPADDLTTEILESVGC